MNLFRAVKNSPTGWVDPSGLDGLRVAAGGPDGNPAPTESVITIDLQDRSGTDWHERTFGLPSDTVWTGERASLEDVKKIILRQMGNSRCIRRLTLTAHGDSGVAYLGPNDTITLGQLKSLKTLAPGNELRRKIEAKVAFLLWLRGKMCKGGEFVLAQCKTAEGEKGKELMAALKEILGNDIKLKAFDTNIYWWMGAPWPRDGGSNVKK
jgi:hypothetical protein